MSRMCMVKRTVVHTDEYRLKGCKFMKGAEKVD